MTAEEAARIASSTAWLSAFCFSFFFQAEDGIRDADVTGVQTCALPISDPYAPRDLQRQEAFGSSRMEVTGRVRIRTENNCLARDIVQVGDALLFGYNVFLRSEERRVGKEWSARGAADEEEKKHDTRERR